MINPRSDAIFQIGELLNNTFRIEAILGRGGTSEVYRARNEISGRPVALKVLRSEYAGNEDFLVLMKREEQMRDIRHDAVVGYSENHRTADGHIYLVMDYVDGPSLEARLKHGGLPANDILVVGRRVTEGLRAAHARKIVHRDLSPDNIILRDGDPAQAVIIDFGIAKDANPGAATIVGNEFAGKFSYAAPEQLAGNTDARSDIYSLGATLLAAFRGKPPNVGTNLMDVVRIKNEPLDTSDVPEPLKTIIERMTAPAPEARFQSCQEILDAITPPPGGQPDDPDRTVIRPLSPPDESHARAKKPAKAAGSSAGPADKGSSGGSRGPLVAALIVAVAAAAGGGAWYKGVLGGNRYPVADPFVLRVEQPDGGVPAAGGNVPSEAALEALTRIVDASGGTAGFTLASGEIADGWEDGVEKLLGTAVQLDAFQLSADGNQLELVGETQDEASRDEALALFDPGALPEGLSLAGQIDFGPALLTAEALQPVLQQVADCGPLETPDMPAEGFGRGQPVRVTGKLSGTGARITLFDAVAAVAGDREIEIETEILNPSLCLVEQHLPDVAQGGVEIVYSFGKDGAPNPSGRFYVGENPVIDIEVPAGITSGYLYASIIDVTGSVFHLLPNVSRPDNSVEALRAGQDGPITIRLAYPVGESNGPGKLAFLVDDSLLGKSKVMVLHTNDPLFEELRPMTESAEGYAAALEAEQLAHAGTIRSLDSRTVALLEP